LWREGEIEGTDLKTIPLFSGLSDLEREQVGTVARSKRWAVGDVVVNEQEFAFDFYAIKEGEANVQQGDELIRVLRSGDFFGEIGVVPSAGHGWSRRRSATVVITAPTTAIAISGDDFRRLVDDIPALGNAVRVAAADRGVPDAS
jgi:CRP-like cAMP-binding protein